MIFCVSLFSPYLRSRCCVFALTETGNTDVQLTTLETLLTGLQGNLGKLKTDVTAVKDRVSVTLEKDGCKNCDSLKPVLQELTLDSLTVSVSAHRI